MKATIVTTGPPPTVRIDESTTPVTATALSHYTPVVGHRVLVTLDGQALYIVGRIP